MLQTVHKGSLKWMVCRQKGNKRLRRVLGCSCSVVLQPPRLPPSLLLLQLIHLQVGLRQRHHLWQHLGHPQVLHLVPHILHLQ